MSYSRVGPAALVCLLAFSPLTARAQAPAPVTVHNFARAETDHYFAIRTQRGGFGRLMHDRDVASVTDQTVIRMNRDTLYSTGVFDLDAGPVTVELPDTAGRFMSLLPIDNDHYMLGVFHAPTQHVFTREAVGTRYLMLGIRTFVNPNDPADVRAAQALQDRIAVQQADAGRLELGNWDKASLDELRSRLNGLLNFGARLDHGFGARGEVNPIDHLIATAAGWGGNPPSAAVYHNLAPPISDGSVAYRMRFDDVPVDGFWSVTVYNSEGFMVPNPQNAYSINNVTGQKGADGAITVQFGACTDAAPNCLPAPRGWNVALRLYRPRPAVVDGSWQVPALERVP
jgi:hypothetical protein